MRFTPGRSTISTVTGVSTVNWVVPSSETVTVMSVAPSSSARRRGLAETVTPVGAVSLSWIVPVAAVTPSGTISCGEVEVMRASSSTTRKVSLPSTRVSSVVATVNVALVLPAAMATVPVAAG